MDEESQVTLTKLQWVYLLGFLEAVRKPDESVMMTDICVSIGRQSDAWRPGP